MCRRETHQVLYVNELGEGEAEASHGLTRSPKDQEGQRRIILTTPQSLPREATIHRRVVIRGGRTDHSSRMD